ncbi:MAG TPA: L-histidine N(alpha)-methyltransferase [Pyrinomonadaceae bacterium]|nr:L-histidine N(alpha)-methyltransferase [Pyrinomonadaceae bacterium]
MPSKYEDNSAFERDVIAGLSMTPKRLSSRYFYDDEGSRLFQEIMTLPEYYLTDCETEIFTEQTDAIIDGFLAEGTNIDIVELGAGDGSKTAILLKSLLERDASTRYSPIDISEEAIGELVANFRDELPELTIEPHVGDYFAILDSLRKTADRRKIILFLGSNIGNFRADAAKGFFGSLRAVMNDNDLLFIGFDLQKDPRVIHRAYDDPEGVTARFNLNLLERINRELGGNFVKENFLHYANYRPIEGAARSYLISREKQTVEIAGQRFDFERWEPIYMEISQKYSIQMIEDFAREAGFRILKNFFDSREYYCDSLWRTEPR